MTKRPYDTRLPTRTADAAPTPPPPATPSPETVVAAQRASAAVAAAAQPVRVVASGTGPLVFSQATPAATWSIRHAFGRYPQVASFDDQGLAIVGAVRYRDVNWVELLFSEPVAGKAVLT